MGQRIAPVLNCHPSWVCSSKSQYKKYIDCTYMMAKLLMVLSLQTQPSFHKWIMFRFERVFACIKFKFILNLFIFRR